MSFPDLRTVACAIAVAMLAGCTAPAAAPALVQTRTAPVVVHAPPADWSALAGRRVRIAAPLVVSGNHALGDGRLIASFDGRLYAPTEVAMPGPAARALVLDNRARTLELALPRGAAGDPARWRSGGRIEGAEGRLDVVEGQPRLALDAAPALQPAARPAAPVVDGDVRVASLNLENLFNGDGRGGGWPSPRGARDQAGYLRQRDALVATLHALDPDIAALMELENDGGGPESSIAQLVEALNAAGRGHWRFVDSGHGPGSDAIRVGLAYRADRVSTVGRSATTTDGSFRALSRAPLAQAFRAGDGPVFTVVVNHFKSKGCRDAEGADRDQGDGQACWNATRTASARALDAWLDTDPTGSGSALALLIGDLNAYALEDPVRTLLAAGWRDALADATPSRYSFVFDGQAGRLDHALLSPALAARLGGAAIWHANADEAEAAAPAAASPWRSSDHDPLLVALRLRDR